MPAKALAASRLARRRPSARSRRKRDRRSRSRSVDLPGSEREAPCRQGSRFLRPRVGLRTPVRQRWNLAADHRDTGRINGRVGDTDTVRCSRHHCAPRVDHHRPSIAPVARRVRAPLRGGYHVQPVFDGAGADQRLPVILASRQRKCRRQHDRLRALQGQDAKQLREAQVVADGQPDQEAIDLRDDNLIAGSDRGRLLVLATPSSTTSNIWILL